MYRYETHMHTKNISKCAQAGLRESLEFYKSLGYDGVFVTNHFIDGNTTIDKTLPYEKQIELFFEECEEGKRIGKEIGISVFEGLEAAYKGTDFLVYGLGKEWFLNNPQITEMTKREELEYFIQSGGFVIQAHPYREAGYIDHIRLFPRSVCGVEVINASLKDETANKMAEIYADAYGLLKIAGSDNHIGKEKKKLAGIETEIKINTERDFINSVKSGKTHIFSLEL